jgi:hypothetical protein
MSLFEAGSSIQSHGAGTCLKELESEPLSNREYQFMDEQSAYVCMYAFALCLVLQLTISAKWTERWGMRASWCSWPLPSRHRRQSQPTDEPRPPRLRHSQPTGEPRHHRPRHSQLSDGTGLLRPHQRLASRRRSWLWTTRRCSRTPAAKCCISIRRRGSSNSVMTTSSDARGPVASPLFSPAATLLPCLAQLVRRHGGIRCSTSHHLRARARR